MRHGVRRLLVIFALSACAAARPAPLETLLQKHMDSRGGAARIEAVRSLQADLTLEEPEFKVDIRYVADRAGKARVDVFHEGKRVFSEGVDEGGGWAAGEDGVVKEIAPAGTAALEHGRLFNLYGLHEYSSLGHRLTMEGQETIEGRTYDVIRLDLADGFRTWRLIDRQSGAMEIQRDLRALHPDVDPTELWIESRNADFRAVDGVVFPFASKQYEQKTGKWLQTTEVRSIQVNPELPPAALRRPAE